jgi:hypothetical protein
MCTQTEHCPLKTGGPYRLKTEIDQTMPVINHTLLRQTKLYSADNRGCFAGSKHFLANVLFALTYYMLCEIRDVETLTLGWCDNITFNLFQIISVISYPLQNPIKNVIKSPT